MNRLKKFATGAGMFALMGIIAKLIGVFYRLPLTNILGAEGMGLYQMIFPLYSFVLALLCGGLPAAISKYVSELLAQNKISSARRTLTLCLIILSAAGLVTALIILLLRDKIAELQGNAAAGIAYIAIAPALLFSCLIACVRGYFQGYKNLLPSGISQIIEQLIKAAFGLAFAAALMPRGIQYGVLGALAGITLSEFAAFAYLLIRYAFFGRRKLKSARLKMAAQAEAATDIALAPNGMVKAEKLKAEEKVKAREIIKRVYSVALPITLGSLVIPLSGAVDSFLIVNLLVKSGVETHAATALYGLFNGPVGSLINMPSVVTVALAASLLPAIASAQAKGASATSEWDRSVNVFLFFILPVAVVFVIAPRPILGLLYSRGLTEVELGEATSLLRIEAVNVIFIGFIQLCSALLQGKGKAKLPVVNLIIGALLKIAISVLTIPIMGIYGAALGNVVCYGVTCLLDLIAARRHYGKFLYPKHCKLVLSLGVFALTLCSYNILSLFISDIIAFICAFVAASALYLTLSVKTKCILLREILP